MDDIDRRLLELLQSGFPVTEQPFAKLGEQLGISESEVMDRTEKLLRDGLIRRLGASLNPRKLGYTSTLAAARVPLENLDRATDFINSFPQVTHNYLRDDEFNVWFTVIARSDSEIDDLLEGIRKESGAAEVISLPQTHLFKIKVDFKID